MPFNPPGPIPQRILDTGLEDRWLAAKLNGVADEDLDAACNAMEAAQEPGGSPRFDAAVVEAARLFAIQRRGLEPWERVR